MSSQNNASPEPARTPLPDDIKVGEIQYLYYKTGPIRGQCNTLSSVVITWPSGFTQTSNSDIWNDRGFLNSPDQARLATQEQSLRAAEFFANLTAHNSEMNKNIASLRPFSPPRVPRLK